MEKTLTRDPGELLSIRVDNTDLDTPVVWLTYKAASVQIYLDVSIRCSSAGYPRVTMDEYSIQNWKAICVQYVALPTLFFFFLYFTHIKLQPHYCQ